MNRQDVDDDTIIHNTVKEISKELDKIIDETVDEILKQEKDING